MPKVVGVCTIEVEPGRAGSEGKPGVSPTYRNTAAAEHLPVSYRGATTLLELFNNSVQRFPDARCLGWRPVDAEGNAGAYIFHSFYQVQVLANHVASALHQCGIGPGDRLGICSANNVEWMLTARAADVVSGVVVPIYDTLGESAVEYIIQHSGLSLALVEASKLKAFVQVVDSVKDRVKTLVYIGKGDEALLQKARGAGLKVYSFGEFLELGKGRPVEPKPPKPDDLCCIMYTSGTTGAPKGVELTHRNFVAGVAGAGQLLADSGLAVSTNDCLMSYLPLAHSFGRLLEEFGLAVGGHIGYWRGNPKLLLDDVKELQPTLFIAVPRILERIADGVKHKLEAAGGFSKSLFDWAYSYKLWRLKRGAPGWWAGMGVDQLVFGKIRAAMGGRVRFIVSGGAPLAPHVEDFCNVALGPLLQARRGAALAGRQSRGRGYGLTETCAASFVMMPNETRMAYTVGPPLSATEFRFESVPELNYDATANPPKGEICIRGPMVFKGYHKDEEKTKEAFDEDGFFHTGDIGTLTAQGCLKIIDRKKNIFKMAQGEYIAVEHLESVYCQSNAVEQVWVYGNSFESQLVAVVVPQRHWLKQQQAGGGGSQEDLQAAAGSQEVRKAMLAELTRVGKEARLKGFELVKEVHLEVEPFSVENDLMTPSLKVKRPQLLKHYQAQVDAMYEALHSKAQPAS
ncbi:hypothetical protein N2152v2_005435 [Parachlorella kessleri]